MSSKKLLNESQVRQFMKLAKLEPLSKGFVHGLSELRTGRTGALGPKGGTQNPGHGRGQGEAADGSLFEDEDLEAQDAVYPYNHKLLIEGYDYSLGFQGEQIYQGVDEFYGALLRFSTPEKFEDEDNDANLSIFTLVEYNGNLYFKVKVDPTDGSWRDELISVEYMTHRETGSQLYVKAIVSSLDSRISPHINHFQVRVI